MSIKNTLLILIITILVTFTYSTFGFGKCKVRPSPKVVNNFDASKYVGLWYEQYRDKQTPFQSGECTTAEYSLNDDGSIKVVNSEIQPGKSERTSVTGKAICDNSPIKEAKCKVNFGPEFLEKFKFALGDYWVFDTDYENFSIVYACREIVGAFHYEFVWILTREAEASEEQLEEYYGKAVNDLGYRNEDIRRKTIQGGTCPY